MLQQFGKYLLQRKLAEGGMAEVFLAKQSGMEGFEKPVVIKRILPHLSGEPQFVDMFLNEAKVAARLSHPAIVQIFDFGRIDGQYYIAMEFIHGEDLRNLAKAAEKSKKRPSMALVCRVVADMLGALHYAHTRAGPDGRKLGLVHRDISPQNVLVTYEGSIKIVDFGIAKATQAQSGAQTQAGLLKGKYAYMSPEQCRGKAIDARSDVFAVGILLWELLTWKRLFRRETDLATLVAVADEPIPSVASVRRDIPPELDRIVTMSLTRPLEQRYASAQAMQADLEAVIRRFGWEADSIALQTYMRDVFAEKLRQQDDAIRAAGLGSIEDFLVQADEGTQMAWIDQGGHTGGDIGTPVGMPLPARTGAQPILPPHESSAPQFALPPHQSAPQAPMQMRPSQRIQIAATPQAMTMQAEAPVLGPNGYEARPEFFTGSSTLQGAAAQSVPRDPTNSQFIVAPPVSRWKRAAVIGGIAVAAAAALVGVVFWPEQGGGGGGGVATNAGGGGVVTTPASVDGEAKIRVTLVDERDAETAKAHPAAVLVDGTPQPPPSGGVVEVTVKAGKSVEVRVEVDGKAVGAPQKIGPLEAGEVQPLRRKIGG